MTSLDPDDPFEPGVDLHEWASRRASIEEDLDADPDAALSQLADVVQQMLESNGYAVRDPVARGGEEPEVVVTYVSAREIAERAEVGAASRAEVEMAVEDLREVFDALARDTGAAA